ncbi:MAG: hypothetical protein IKR90_07145 [Clostridia bacterium]|nr:hypothetical protein [Clostridia bacterium]
MNAVKKPVAIILSLFMAISVIAVAFMPAGAENSVQNAETISRDTLTEVTVRQAKLLSLSLFLQSQVNIFSSPFPMKTRMLLFLTAILKRLHIVMTVMATTIIFALFILLRQGRLTISA